MFAMLQNVSFVCIFVDRLFCEASDLIVDVLQEGHACPPSLFLYDGVGDTLQFERHGASCA